MARIAALTAEHRQFFFKFGHLHLQEIFSSMQSAALQQEIGEIWAARSRDKNLVVSEQATLVTRDLWRQCPTWQKALRFAPLGTLMAQLWSRTPLRLLYDQLLYPTSNSGASSSQSAFSIEGMSSFSRTVGGIVLCLGSDGTSVRFSATFPSAIEGETPSCATFECTAGSGVLIAPTAQIRFLENRTCHSKVAKPIGLLACAGELSARYIENRSDPGQSALFHLGYSFGDLLRDNTHPHL